MPFLAAINAGFVTSRVVLPGTGSGGAGGGGGGGGNAEANGFIVRNNFTGMSNERFYGIGTDSSNNFYATGYDAVDDNILIAKYNSSGTFQWARKAANAGNGPDRIFGSQVDSSGNIITGGYSYSHSGGSPYPALITKYQPDGTEVYTKVFTDGGSASWIGQATAIDSNDNFYITGRGRNQSSNNNDYTFVAKLNSAGAMVWIQKLDHGGQQSNGRALAIDSDDNVIVAGAIHEEITGGGYSSGFVAKLSGTDGSITWQRILNDDVQANGYHNDSFMAVTVDSNKDVYTTGYNNFEYLGTSYSPIVKLSGTDGSVTWQRRHLTTNGSTGISAIGTSVYVVTDDNKILIYNASGTLTGEWVVTATSGSYYTEDIKSDQNGNAVVVGFYYSTGSQAEPFFAVLPATIIAGTSDNFILTAGSLGDVAGTLATNAFTTISSNAVNSITVSNASNMASSTQASDGNVITAITGGSSGGGGSSAQWWGTRGMAVGGQQPSNSNIMQYIDITTTGNAIDFGDMTTTDANASAGGNGTRGVRIGGNLNNTTMDYWAFATLGNATDFGDTNTAKALSATVADGTKAITGGASVSGYQNSIEYITVDTTGNGTDFGDLLGAEGNIAGTNDTTRGIFAGGSQTANVIQYITMATPGNAIDFGDLLGNTSNMLTGTVSDNTYGVFQGGVSGGYSNVIQYITIQSAGNSTDFGDLAQARAYGGQTSDATSKRGVTLGGYVNPGGGGVALDSMEYITIDTPGNAADFGDLTGGNERAAGVSGSPGGGSGGASLNWGGDRAIIWGNNEGSNDGIAIDYFDITTPGNAADFGDVHRQVDGFGPGKYEGSCVSDTTYGVYAGGKSSYNLNSTNQIDYITIGTLGNSATFGNLTTKTHKRPASASDGTTGYFSGGQDDYNVTYYTGTDTITIATQGNATLSSFVLATGIQYTTGTQDTSRMLISGGYTNGNTNNDLIQYLTFASAGTSQTFGNLTINRAQAAAVSDNTYALIGGGYDSANLLQSTDVVTIQTTGNATNFGNLTSAKRNLSAVSNGTYGCFCAGWSNLVDIDRFTIATAGNATDFGDLIGGGEAPGACSGSAS